MIPESTAGMEKGKESDEASQRARNSYAGPIQADVTPAPLSDKMLIPLTCRCCLDRPSLLRPSDSFQSLSPHRNYYPNPCLCHPHALAKKYCLTHLQQGPSDP